MTYHATPLRPDDEAAYFREAVHESLRTGQALLLVDGLDEISDEGARLAFANHLRTFVGMFPSVAVIVTSREAGFRLIAGVIASICSPAILAPLDENEVKDLCERWHVEVVGDTDKVRSDARTLAQNIWANDRIRILAENPLLLTTLLVVKRWIGELPRGRAALYKEAVKVLIRTWNVEGYEAMDEDETLAQLSYIACAMMDRGIQQIGEKDLLKLLQNARRELEAELAFIRISPREFIQRIEYRSSLLMQTGHDQINGELQPVYEFRHLTFQEYLAARGFVEEQFPDRNDGHTLVELLEPHFVDERWREVIPLAAVLAGRKAEPIILNLTKACREIRYEFPSYIQSGELLCAWLLNQCLLDEVQVTISTLKSALIEIGRHHRSDSSHSVSVSIHSLRQGKFGALLEELTEQTYLNGCEYWPDYLFVLEYLTIDNFNPNREPIITKEFVESLNQMLIGSERTNQIKAALVFMWIAFNLHNRLIPIIADTEDVSFIVREFQQARDSLKSLLDLGDLPIVLPVCWALAWIGGVMVKCCVRGWAQAATFSTSS